LQWDRDIQGYYINNNHIFNKLRLSRTSHDLAVKIGKTPGDLQHVREPRLGDGFVIAQNQSEKRHAGCEAEILRCIFPPYSSSSIASSISARGVVATGPASA